jgi:hypothetical protein
LRADEQERGDRTLTFLKEILQILPLVGLRAFEVPKPVATPMAMTEITSASGPRPEKDTIIVPAQRKGFEKAFLGEDCWCAIRIAGGMLPKIKYVAAYQSQPVSAVTHYAPVDRIEPYGEEGKYRLIFSAKARPLDHPIPFADAASGAMQGPRYTSFERLKTAKRLTDLI